MSTGTMIIVAIVVGLIIGLIVTGIMRAGLKSVHLQSNAEVYIRGTGLNLTKNRDIFLYSKVDKTAKPKDDNKK